MNSADLQLWVAIAGAILTLAHQVYRIWKGKENRLSRTVDALVRTIEDIPAFARTSLGDELREMGIPLSQLEEVLRLVQARVKLRAASEAEDEGVEKNTLGPKVQAITKG